MCHTMRFGAASALCRDATVSAPPLHRFGPFGHALASASEASNASNANEASEAVEAVEAGEGPTSHGLTLTLSLV